MANIPAMTEAAEEAAASGTTAGTRLDRDSLLTAGMAVMGLSLIHISQGKESGRRPERRTAAPRVPGALRQVPA